ncbi:MAG: hypothetical protein U0103_23890 [Candidatus Obscuribacterales bacterium]
MMPRRLFTVAIIYTLFASITTHARNSDANTYKEIEESVSKDPGVVESVKFRTFPVAFTARKIPKGHVFTAADLEDHNINYEHVPPDAVISCKKLYGRKCVEPLNALTVVSVRDIGIPLTPNQIISAKARNWDNSTEKLGPIYVSETAIKAGDRIKKENIRNSKMPLRLEPCDVVNEISQVIGKKCKFGCAKNHILMQHDLF